MIKKKEGLGWRLQPLLFPCISPHSRTGHPCSTICLVSIRFADRLSILSSLFKKISIIESLFFTGAAN